MKRLTLLILALVAIVNGLSATTVYNNLFAISLGSGGTCAIAECNFANIPDVLEIPSEIEYAGTRYTVVEIYGSVFNGCSQLKKIIIPETITEIKSETFLACNNLEEVVLPKSLKSIGFSAFRNCSSLKTIVFPEGLGSIGERAFQSCSSLESIELPDKLANLGESAFSWCTALKRAKLPAELTSIPSMLFYEDSHLTEVEFPAGLLSIESSAFARCGFTHLTIPATLMQIGESAFAYCGKLTDLSLSEGLSEIGPNMFSGSSALKTVKFPASLRKIGEEAFYDSGLKEVVIPEGVFEIGDGAFQSSSVSRIILPSSLTTISNNFASFCPCLKEIVIPNSVNSIGQDAFYGSRLYYVSLGSNVKTIERGAFSCPEMRLYCTATTPPVARDLSFNTAGSSLYVKEESLSAYRNAYVWKDFGTIASLTSADAEVVTINQMFDDVVVMKGETIALTATVYPLSSTPAKLTWTSSDTSIATVSSNGEVTGVDYGIAVVTVTTPSGKSISCEVKVGERLENISLRLGYRERSGSMAISGSEPITLPANTSNRFEVKIYPEPAEAAWIWLADDIAWSVSDNTVAQIGYEGTVSNYEKINYYKANPLTLLSPGTAVLTARTNSGYEASFTINVVGPDQIVEPKALTVSAEKTSIEVGETMQLNARFDPDDTTVKIVSWSNPDTSVATVDADGLLTAVGWGAVRIYASSSFPNLEDWIEITVTDANHIEVADVEIMLDGKNVDGTTQNVAKGETIEFSAIVLPENATDKRVRWTSSNENVAAVDADGRVTALSQGDAEITVSSFEDIRKNSRCVVKVLDNSGIEDVMATGDVIEEVFTPGGIKIDLRHGTPAPGVYIVRRGAKVEKRVIH